MLYLEQLTPNITESPQNTERTIAGNLLAGETSWKIAESTMSGWMDYLKSKKNLLCAFAKTIRHNHYGRDTRSTITANTVDSAITGVCSSFRTNFRDNPSLEASGQPSLALKRQINSYQQKVLPVRVFKKL